MKAIKIKAEKEMSLVEMAEPSNIKEDEILLHIEYVGFCGSDLSTYLGKNPMVKMPVIPGHEVGAVIKQVGSEVPEQDRKSTRLNASH